MEKETAPMGRAAFMQACYVPIPQDNFQNLGPPLGQEFSTKRPAIFDDLITKNPYRWSFTRKSQCQHESVVNNVGLDDRGEVLFESRVDLDADCRSVDEESFLKSLPPEKWYSLTQSVASLGLSWHSFDQPVSVGQDLGSLFKQVTDLKKLVAPDLKYRDPAFKASIESIRGTSSDTEAERFASASWIRLSDIFKGQSISLYGTGINPLDIEQGELGNCYFLSVASSLAQYPARIKRLIQVDPDSARIGIYSVLLCNSGVWLETIIDDKFPCMVYGNTFRVAFNKSSNGNVWGMILEKAWAKIIGGYCSISSGTCSEGMHLLTGAPVESVRIEMHKPNDVLQMIHRAIEKGHIMTASSHSTVDENMVGILKSHAYSILGLICLREVEPGFYQLEHPDGNYKLDTPGLVFLLRLRNPWASKDRWKGKWSFHDSIWQKNYEILGSLGLDKVRDRTGIVLIDFREFLTHFIEFDICKYEDDAKYTFWNVGQPKGIPEFYNIDVQSPGNYTFGISQVNPRILPAIDQQRYELSRASLVVFNYNEQGKPQYVKGNCSSRLHTFVECSNLKAGKYVLIVTLHWKCDIEQACLNAYGPGTVVMQRISVAKKDKWEIVRSVYKSRAKMFDGTKNEKLTNIPGLDPKISYKHQILDDGFGYFYFANRSTAKKVVFFVTLLAMDNLEFTEPMPKVVNQFEVTLPPRTADIRVYCQVSAPNRIKFKMKVQESIVAPDQIPPQISTPRNQVYHPLLSPRPVQPKLKNKDSPPGPSNTNENSLSPTSPQ